MPLGCTYRLLVSADARTCPATRGRKWATERTHLPVQDVARVGGWRDLATLQECYEHVDEATVLAVVTEPRQLREAKSAAEG